MTAKDGDHYNELGNALYKQQSYNEALKYYNQAIACEDKNAVYCCNRSACYLKLQCYNGALDDAINASNIDSKYARAYHQLVECYLIDGNYGLARHTHRKLEKLSPQLEALPQLLSKIDKLESDEQQALHLLSENDNDSALDLAKSISAQSPANNRSLSIQVECLLRLYSIDEAQDIYYENFCSEEHLSEIKYLRALINYYRNELDTAIELCKSILEDDPDFSKAIKLFKMIKRYKDVLLNGSRAFSAGDFKAADHLYTQGLSIDSTNRLILVKLYVNKTITSLKLKNYLDAITFSTKALEIDAQNHKCYFNRAQAYLNTGDKGSAIADYIKAYELNKDQEILKRLEALTTVDEDKEKKSDSDDKSEKQEEKNTKSQYDVNEFISRFKNENQNSFQNYEEVKKTGEDEETKKKLAELKDVLRKMQKMKAHEVLNVQLHANEQEIRKAYAKLVKAYHPDHFARFPQLKQVCEDIFKLMQGAKRTFEKK